MQLFHYYVVIRKKIHLNQVYYTSVILSDLIASIEGIKALLFSRTLVVEVVNFTILLTNFLQLQLFQYSFILFRTTKLPAPTKQLIKTQKTAPVTVKTNFTQDTLHKNQQLKLSILSLCDFKNSNNAAASASCRDCKQLTAKRKSIT